VRGPKSMGDSAPGMWGLLVLEAASDKDCTGGHYLLVLAFRRSVLSHV
jgi:hypothetical protein